MRYIANLFSLQNLTLFVEYKSRSRLLGDHSSELSFLLKQAIGHGISKILFSISKRNIFPVVNKEKELVGVISLDEILDIIFNTEPYDKVNVSELMHTPPASIDQQESMARVLETFEETEARNLPVTENGQYKGFISLKNSHVKSIPHPTCPWSMYYKNRGSFSSMTQPSHRSAIFPEVLKPGAACTGTVR